MRSRKVVPLDGDLPGYLSPNYAFSYRQFGEILQLPLSGLYLLKRPIEHGSFDFVGLYPYAMCPDWPKLNDDLMFLRDTGAVSVTFVADPFRTDEIRQFLADWHLCRPFKTHYTVNVNGNWWRSCPKEVRRITRRSLECQSFEVASYDPKTAQQLWTLYQNSIVRHDIRGIQRLSLDTIEMQLKVEGLVLVVGQDDTGVTGAMMAFRHDTTANAHVEFLSSEARTKGTSYGLIFTALRELERLGCRLVNLGGAAGLVEDRNDGLAQFKRRWANSQCTALICGTILDPSAYAALSAAANHLESDYFPVYRAPGGPFDWNIVNS